MYKCKVCNAKYSRQSDGYYRNGKRHCATCGSTRKYIKTEAQQ